MKYLKLFFSFSWLLIAYAAGSQVTEQPVDYVDPFIGTGGHGHTYPGVSVPFGMVQLSPDTRLEGWDGCSAYHASDSVIYGFSHTHLSGTGCSDYGDILFMPFTGEVNLVNYLYASPFKASDENATAGFYEVILDKYQVRVELTATARAGFHRYTFPASENAGIIIDLKHRDRVLESRLHIVNETEIEGMRVSRAWASRQIVYFVARFSKPFTSHMAEVGDELSSEIKEITGENVIAKFLFSTGNGEQVLVKVGISAVSIDGARKNLDTEIPGWDFDNTRNDAYRLWNNELSKISIEGGSRDQKTIFYTSLYHSLLNPNLYMDVDGQYRGRDLKVHQAAGFDYYTVFSLWDTYRAAHPLFTLIEQKRSNDFIQTFIRQYLEGGMLPVWELSGNETGCMIGYHAVPVIADAYLKGIRNYDVAKAFEAMNHSAEQDHLGLRYFKSKGYIPGDKEGESVSKTLEYAYDDWCIAQMAKALGKEAEYSRYLQRAQYYKNVFDPSTGFMRAKMNEAWFSPFDPAEVNFNYTEANAWQYSFYVPQDIDGLVRLHGGKGKFSAKLDEMFSATAKTTGREQVDISGLIGQYAHGNEPSHHMAYLYDYAGEPWKTQSLVHRICKDLYTDERDGLCGNEDCGQMSSWYVLSALGFYPVTPGSNIYAIGTPLFPQATLNLENGKKMVIKADKVSKDNYYIQSATLNGMPYDKSYLSHSDIMNGGQLVFIMGPEPNKKWGSKPGSYPPSKITEHLITPVPFIDQGQKTFTDSTVVALSCPQPGVKIHFTLDGSEPQQGSGIYQKPFVIRTTSTVKAFAAMEGQPNSFTISAEFLKIPQNRKIILNTRYASQYSAGGDMALIDFIKGGDNFRTGSWQGYEGVDLDAVIDLGEVQPVQEISTRFLQDTGSWIFLPTEVDYYLSTDGNKYKQVAVIPNDIPESNSEPLTREFVKKMSGEKARFVKVVARNRGVCPPWHAGAGSKAWIFADEILVQ